MRKSSVAVTEDVEGGVGRWPKMAGDGIAQSECLHWMKAGSQMEGWRSRLRCDDSVSASVFGMQGEVGVAKN